MNDQEYQYDAIKRAYSTSPLGVITWRELFAVLWTKYESNGLRKYLVFGVSNRDIYFGDLNDPFHFNMGDDYNLHNLYFTVEDPDVMKKGRIRNVFLKLTNANRHKYVELLTFKQNNLALVNNYLKFSQQKCRCGIPCKRSFSSDKGRFYVGCILWPSSLQCGFFQWFDLRGHYDGEVSCNSGNVWDLSPPPLNPDTSQCDEDDEIEHVATETGDKCSFCWQPRKKMRTVEVQTISKKNKEVAVQVKPETRSIKFQVGALTVEKQTQTADVVRFYPFYNHEDHLLSESVKSFRHYRCKQITHLEHGVDVYLASKNMSYDTFLDYVFDKFLKEKLDFGFSRFRFCGYCEYQRIEGTTVKHKAVNHLPMIKKSDDYVVSQRKKTLMFEEKRAYTEEEKYVFEKDGDIYELAQDKKLVYTVQKIRYCMTEFEKLLCKCNLPVRVEFFRKEIYAGCAKFPTNHCDKLVWFSDFLYSSV